MAVESGYAGPVITQRQLHAIGQDFRDWLFAHKDEFPPLKIVDIRYQEDELLGETIIQLTVCWDPTGLGPNEGFSVPAVQEILRAVNNRQGEFESPVQLCVRMEAICDNEEYEEDEDDGEDD